MSLNCVEIDKIISEISIDNCFIQNVFQPNFYSLVLELYGQMGLNKNENSRKRLLFSLKQQETALFFSEQGIKKSKKQQRFVQFLKSKIVGGRILECLQIGNNRIIKITIKHNDEKYYFWCRLWSNNANIVVTDEKNIILDSFYRRPKKDEVSGKTFRIPENKNNNEKKYSLREFNNDKEYNQNIAELYQSIIKEKNLDEIKKRAKNILEQNITYKEHSTIDIEKQIAEYENFETYKKCGELLSANIFKIEKNSHKIELTDWNTDEKIEIKLNPQKTPSENVEEYFKKYKKSKTGLIYLLEKRDNNLKKISIYKDELNKIEECEDINYLNRIIEKNREDKKQNNKTDESIGLEFQSNGFKILVGRNSKENDILLRKFTRGNDIWLHTRDYPGGYVFVKSIKNKSIPLETLLDAGNLAIWFSKAKNASVADLYYTNVKYLKRAKNGPRGLVIPTNEKNLRVSLDKDRLERLLN